MGPQIECHIYIYIDTDIDIVIDIDTKPILDDARCMEYDPFEIMCIVTRIFDSICMFRATATASRSLSRPGHTPSVRPLVA